MTSDDKTDEAFLARWSRRKRTSEPGTSEPTAAAAVEPSGRGQTAHDQPPPFDLASLPKIEDLLPDSDFKVFLQQGVPEELKRMALRKAWSLDPTIRDFVEVAENQYDWNAPDGVPGFGPLAQGTDIEALLAQATGQIRELVEPEAAVARADRSATSATNLAADERLNDTPNAKAEQAAAAPDPLPSSSTAAPLPVARTDAPEPSEEQNQPASSGRRRHGGALPRAT